MLFRIVIPGSPMALVVFLSGKLFVTVSYMTIYIYTAEMFPTSSRHSAFAVCSMFGCVGSMLAPQVPLLVRPTFTTNIKKIIVFCRPKFTSLFLWWFSQQWLLPQDFSHFCSQNSTMLKRKKLINHNLIIILVFIFIHILWI